MKIFHTAKRQTSTKRWIRLRELIPYAMVPVWATGLKAQWKKCFLPLIQKIRALWENSGRDFTVQYLKECVRITVLWTSRLPYTPQERGVRVSRSRTGLPLILPSSLRKLISTSRRFGSPNGWVALRVALTLLSVYRVMSCRPNLKLETITGPFQGSTATLPDEEVRHASHLLGITLTGIKPAFPDLFSEAAGPNFPRATWSSGLDALAFFRHPKLGWHWLVIAVQSRSWSLLSWWLGILLISAPVVPLLVILGVMPRRLGRLAKLFEAAGKVRIVAITDWWTQCLLLPLHQKLFDGLNTVLQDCTFDQIGHLGKVREFCRGRPAYSFDLSAATDRLPVALQEQILRILGLKWSAHWRALLTSRAWWLGSDPIMYAVGQPMGAYSSWAMLALTHHVIVQVSAYRAGWRHFFPYYAVLGDDIVIFDTQVAKEYQDLMAILGVPINMSKSLVSDRGFLEFAKRWFDPDRGDFSPLGPGLILVTIRNLRFIPLVVYELTTKSFGFLPSHLKDLTGLIKVLRRKSKIDEKIVSLLALGPTGGLWGSGQLADRSAAWIAAYHSRVAPDLLNLFVWHALCAYTIVQARQAVDTNSAAEKNVIHNWMRYPLFGRGPVMALLSMPLMLFAPGLWATLLPLTKGVNISVRWEAQADSLGEDPFDLNAHAERQFAMRDVSRNYIGSISALNWTDRAKVLDFFAAQNFLVEEVRVFTRDGLYGAGKLVPYAPGGPMIVSERSDGSA